jgi:hypothetical protein
VEPDPYQNVMDPQHWSHHLMKNCILFCSASASLPRVWESALLGVLRREVPPALPGGGAGGAGLHALPRRPGAAGQGGGTGQRSRRYTAPAGGQAKSCQPHGILLQVRQTYRTVHTVKCSVSNPDPDSIRSVDPDLYTYSESGSGSRRAKMTHKSKKNQD